MKRVANIWLLIAFAAVVMAAPRLLAEETMLPGFLAGCWRGELGGGESIEEQYSSPLGGTIFGFVVTSKDAEITFFEFLRIATEGGSTNLHPFPKGKPANVIFKLNEIQSDKLSFENFEHDFPQQITYRLLAEGKLLTRIAGVVNGRKVVDEYTTTRVNCAAG